MFVLKCRSAVRISESRRKVDVGEDDFNNLASLRTILAEVAVASSASRLKENRDRPPHRSSPGIQAP
jgi:hypothetical protein